LASLWVYLLIIKLTDDSVQALLGSVILMSSWQVAYHARWLAPDGILMQFGILSILLAVLSLRASGNRKLIWLCLAAIIAGFTCGTKYYGGLFLVPVFIAGFDIVTKRGFSIGKAIAFYVALVIVFAVAFLITTPGALIQPSLFVDDILFEVNHYSDGHFGYTVQPGLQHISLLFTYLALSAFSRYWLIALLVFLFGILGGYAIFKEYRFNLETLVLLSIPVLYIPYIASQRVMFVRNYLLLFPFLAIFSARGMKMIWESAAANKYTLVRKMLAILVVSALFVNFGWMYTAAYSIQQRNSISIPKRLVEYIQAHPSINYYLSTQIRELEPETVWAGMPNVVDRSLGADVYLYLSQEYPDTQSNRYNQYHVIMGPYEVDYNYYPTWEGDQRVVAISVDNAFRQHFLANTKK